MDLILFNFHSDESHHHWKSIQPSLADFNSTPNVTFIYITGEQKLAISVVAEMKLILANKTGKDAREIGNEIE